MRYIILPIVLTLCWASPLAAQQSKSFIVRTGDIILNRVPLPDRYRFDEFKDARVYFANNTSASGKLNYHFLYAEMQFVDVTGDTVSLANEHLIRRISFDDLDYFYDSEKADYLEVVLDGPLLMLAKKQELRLLEYDVKAMEGYVSSLTPELSRAIFDLDNQIHPENLRELLHSRATNPLLICPHEELFFIDRNHVVHPARKASLRKIFPDFRRELSDYLGENKISFSSKEDLSELVTFCNQLIMQSQY
jgi:hypothetical protein